MDTILLTMLTVVAESLLEGRLLADLRELGATGYTVTEVRGEGSRGVRASEWEGNNVRVETIVDAFTADRILDRIATAYFEHYAVVAWTTEVRVVRGGKYLAAPGAP